MEKGSDFEEVKEEVCSSKGKKQGKKLTDTCPYCGKTVSINLDGSLHAHKHRVVLEKKGDIEEAEEKIAEEVSIFKGKLKFTVKGDYGHIVPYPEREIMNPELVRALAAGDLKDIIDVLFSLHHIDGKVYEELKLQTQTMHQIARDFDMNTMKEFSKLLDVLRKQEGIEHLVVFMKTRCPAKKVGVQEDHPSKLSAGIKKEKEGDKEVEEELAKLSIGEGDVQGKKFGDQTEAEPSLKPLKSSLPIEGPCPHCGKLGCECECEDEGTNVGPITATDVLEKGGGGPVGQEITMVVEVWNRDGEKRTKILKPSLDLQTEVVRADILNYHFRDFIGNENVAQYKVMLKKKDGTISRLDLHRKPIDQGAEYEDILVFKHIRFLDKDEEASPSIQ